MSRVIVSTTSSGLDDLHKPDNIRMLRFNIEVNGTVLQDGLDIDSEQLMDMMRADTSLVPVTSPPSKSELIDFFEALFAEGVKEVLLICVSASISQTYFDLQEIKDYFAGRIFIYLFDSKSLGYIEALLALEAAEMMSNNIGLVEIVEALTKIRKRSLSWFVISDLNSVINNGRIPKTTGLLLNTLNIKPILSINQHGDIVPIAKVRSTKKAIEIICKNAVVELKKNGGKIFIFNVCDDDLVEYMQDCLERYDILDVPIYSMAAVSVAHHGRGVGLGILY